jgi:hypothetical protein
MSVPDAPGLPGRPAGRTGRTQLQHDDLVRIKTLYHDARMGPTQIQKVTGYTINQVKYALKKKTATVGKRSGRPRKGEGKKKKDGEAEGEGAGEGAGEGVGEGVGEGELHGEADDVDMGEDELVDFSFVSFRVREFHAHDLTPLQTTNRGIGRAKQ